MIITMKNKMRQGQALLLTVLALGGAILGATTIAGLLMLNQIRATTDSAHSASAIFAADSGAEWALFDFFCNVTSTSDPNSRCINPQAEGQPTSTFANGVTAEVTCYDDTNAVASCNSVATANYAISVGNSLNSKRAFFQGLSGATSTL